ncbi:MAG: PEGA domain-containing protein [Myxococcota bacterium]
MAEDTTEDRPVPRRIGPFVLLTQVDAEIGVQLWTGVLRGGGGLERKVLVARAPSGSPSAGALDREARLGLDHPQIASVLELYQEGEEILLAYARTPGRTLHAVNAAVHRRYERYPPHVALHVAARAFDALAFAHGAAEPVVHGALQPTTLWLGFDGTVRIRGFGQGPDPRNRQRQPVSIPPPGYASPEHRQGRPLDERADSFGVGCLLFEMLTGRAPPRDELPSLDRVLPDVSPRLAHCVRRATDPDRRQRMSCGDLRDELDRIVHGEDPSFGRASVARWMSQVFGPEALAEADRERILAEEPDLGSFGPRAQRPPIQPTPPPPAQASPSAAEPSHETAPPVQAPPPVAPPPPVDPPSEGARTLPDFPAAGGPPPPQPAPLPPPPSADIAPPTTSPVGSDPLLPVEKALPPKPPQTQSLSVGGLPRVMVAALGAILILVIAALVSPAVRRGLRHAVIGRNPGATLVVESIPSGADVTLNGYATGRKTPFMVENIESGIIHRVELLRPGSETQTATVSLVPGSKHKLNLFFPDAAVRAVIRSNPAEATLLVNGEKADLTPAEVILKVGEETTLAIEQLGYVRWEKKLQPAPNDRIELDVQLEKTEELKAQEAMIEAAKKAAQ